MAEPSTPLSALVLGASGGLGKRLAARLDQEDIHSNVVRACSPASKGSKRSDGCVPVDLKSGEGLEYALHLCTAGHCCLHTVVLCAALSSPAECEQNPEIANAVNVPSVIVNYLLQQYAQSDLPLFIFLSSDNVFSGNISESISGKAWSKVDIPAPINVYGQTKLCAEQLLQRKWPSDKLNIFRSSVIIHEDNGFLNMITSKVRAGTEVKLVAEKRSFVDAQDLIDGIVKGIAWRVSATSSPPDIVINAGGPESISRIELGDRVARALDGSESGLIVSASAEEIRRGYNSPANLTMDTSAFQKLLGKQRAINSSRLKELISIT
jgi:dTDP-4-dehydrorhamnose reductase